MSFDNNLDALNAKWRIYKTKIEAELNKNSIPFGEIQPGYIYNIPLVTGFRQDATGPAIAGWIQDFSISQEKADTPDVKYPVMIGYTLGFRLTDRDDAYFDKALRPLIEAIKLSLSYLQKLSPDQPHYGYYVKLSDFKDEENYAAYSFTVESKVVPMIQLGKDRKNREL